SVRIACNHHHVGYSVLMLDLCNNALRMVYRLDDVYEQLTKTERRKVALVIVELAGDLIRDSENEDQALKSVYDKYSPTNYENQLAAEVGGMKSMIEAVFGVDLGDDLDLKSPEDLLKRAEAHLQNAQAAVKEGCCSA
ncbi:MAG: hypothetical protein VB138_13755, partial [Burkholderia sp.]